MKKSLSFCGIALLSAQAHSQGGKKIDPFLLFEFPDRRILEELPRSAIRETREGLPSAQRNCRKDQPFGLNWSKKVSCEMLQFFKSIENPLIHYRGLSV
jgi:hypothetical protein